MCFCCKLLTSGVLVTLYSVWSIDYILINSRSYTTLIILLCSCSSALNTISFSDCCVSKSFAFSLASVFIFYADKLHTIHMLEKLLPPLNFRRKGCQSQSHAIFQFAGVSDSGGLCSHDNV